MKAGDELAGRWRLESSLGRGGFGEVWKARDGFGAWAIKVLHPHVLRRHPVALADFEREATITAGFSDVVGVGDHVVRVANAGRCPTHGVHYIVMELLRGESLEARLARRGPATPDGVLRFLEPVARVLDHAHGRGEPIIHRDLNPRNVFVAEVAGNEVVKVLDFGIARALNELPSDAAEALLGTPQFMSPEQYARAAVTPASDVWAFGLLAFSVLTGRLFFEREYPAVALDVVSFPLPLASDRAPVPEGFDDWFARCVHRDPRARFPSAGAAVEALRPVLSGAVAGEAIGPVPSPSLPPTMPWSPPEEAGEELVDRLRRPPPMSVPEVADLLAAISVAAAALPEGSRQLGDLRPSNLRIVRVGDRDEVRFASEPLPGAPAVACRTATRPVQASDLSYVAPAELRGERGGPGDVWALAMIAFAAVARKRYVGGDTIEEILARLSALATACPSASERARELGVEGALPEGFDAWFARCTTAPAGQRFRSLEQVALDFQRTVRAAPGPASAGTSRPARRRVALAAGLCVGVLSLAAALLRSPPPPPIAPPDPTREVACNEGVAPACVLAGRAYMRGSDVGHDDARAARLFERACDGDVMKGCTELGVLCMDGRGIPRDLERAARLFTQACDGGERAACRDLGLYYDGQHGVPADPARAARHFERACDLGELRACEHLGQLYENGTGVAPDQERAVSLYERVCDADVASGCAHLGTFYSDGRGVPIDQARAVGFFDRACTHGDYLSCTSAGLSYQRGLGVPRDPARAARLYERGCHGGAALACSALGHLYEAGNGVGRNDALGAALHQRACDAGEGHDCSYLGLLYGEGRVFERDDARAAELFRRGCTLRYAHACTFLGAAYADGRGVERDDARAVELFTQACNDTETHGCHLLGRHYESGRGVARDAARAAQAYRRSCDGSRREESAESCNSLGQLYQNGDGVERNLYNAAVQFNLACTRGSAAGCANVGAIDEQGLGTPRDLERARFHYERACTGGVAYACERLRRLRR